MGSSVSVDHAAIEKMSCVTASYFNREMQHIEGLNMKLLGLNINVGIDDSLLRYSGTNSIAMLNDRSSELLTELGTNGPAYVEKVGSLLAGVSSVPNAVGFGAFLIAMVLQICFSAAKESPSKAPNTGDILRDVFAEEKSSEVRDLMDAYMTRYRAHLHDDKFLLKETKRLESKLSDQLTRLKNSMLKDEKMNDPALKQWTNGAAFHTQMLIHMARLKKKVFPSEFGSTKETARSSISNYHSELNTLLDKYKTYKGKHYKDTENVVLTEYVVLCCAYKKCCDTQCDQFSARETALPNFMEYVFSDNDQIRKLKKYFPDLLTNLDTLADEQGTFQIPGKK